MQQTLATGTTIADLAHIAVQKDYAKGFQDRDVIAKRTVRHLVQTHDCTFLNASLHAAKAIANHEAKGTKARIDITKSTPNCVFVNIEGELRALSVVDLERALATIG